MPDDDLLIVGGLLLGAALLRGAGTVLSDPESPVARGLGVGAAVGGAAIGVGAGAAIVERFGTRPAEPFFPARSAPRGRGFAPRVGRVSGVGRGLFGLGVGLAFEEHLARTPLYFGPFLPPVVEG